MYLMAGQESDRALGDLALRAYAEVDDLAGQAQSSNNLADRGASRQPLGRGSHHVPAGPLSSTAGLGDTDNGVIATCNRAEVLVNQAVFRRGGAPARRRARDRPVRLGRGARGAWSCGSKDAALSRNGQPGRWPGAPRGGAGALRDDRRTRRSRADRRRDRGEHPASWGRGGERFASHRPCSWRKRPPATARPSCMPCAASHSCCPVATSRPTRNLRRGATSEASAQNRFGYALSCLSLSRTQAADAATWAEPRYRRPG